MRVEGTGANPALHALVSDLRHERRLEQVALAGLSEEETGALAGAWLGAPASPDLAAAVRRRTGGNPLFVEELVRHLVESHPGARDEGLVAAAGADVPQGVRSTIERRLARLPEPAGRALPFAAVMGETLPLGTSPPPARRATTPSPTASTRRSTPDWSTRRAPGNTASLTRSYARPCWRG
jgi:predicted ATPase